MGSTLPYGGIQTKVCGDQNSVSRRPHGRKKRRGVKCELGQFIQGFASQARNYLIVLPCHIPVKKHEKKCQFVRVIQFVQSRCHNNFYRNMAREHKEIVSCLWRKSLDKLTKFTLWKVGCQMWTWSIHPGICVADKKLFPHAPVPYSWKNMVFKNQGFQLCTFMATFQWDPNDFTIVAGVSWKNAKIMITISKKSWNRREA